MSGFPEAASGKMASGKVSPTHTPALWEPGHRAGSAGVLGSRIWGEVRRTGCGQAGKTSALLCQGLLGEPGSGGSAAGAGAGLLLSGNTFPMALHTACFPGDKNLGGLWGGSS